MKRISLGTSQIEVPAIALGCMRMDELSAQESERFLGTCLDLGLTYFDHADIYGRKTIPCEERFSQALKATAAKREDILLQSKLGIIPGIMYDNSRDYILSEIDVILKRLQTDYLDVLLLHRPDALVQPEEVAEAFDTLHAAGKVRYFGVSNHRTLQVELLKKYVRQPLLINQLELSLPFATMISAGTEANMKTDGAIDRDSSILDYCRLNGLTIQAWSPYQIAAGKGVFIDHPEYAKLNEVLAELAEKYHSTKTGIASAWIFRHPANMQVVTGTMRIHRITEIAEASDITLTREEWYRLYLAAGHILP